MAPTIQELLVHPIKACRGISLQSARLTPTGLELDRAWCIVDRDGVCIAKMEAISQRKVPILATVQVSFSADRAALLLDAPGMPQLSLPTALEAYAQEEELLVECSGKSTTTGGGWSLGFEEARGHAAASTWISEYLNREAEPGGKRLSGFKEPSRFVVARSSQVLSLASYPSIFPVIERSKSDSDYRLRFEGNARRFADFAPLLVVSRDSARFVSERCPDGGEPYPVRSFRGNIVVEGAPAWAEETWRKIEIRGADAPLVLWKLKECPRCTVPCRDQSTGGWVFPKDALRLWKVLRKAFPGKNRDPEWGIWAGPFFGVYFGNAGQEGTLRVGDQIEVLETCRWDDHLRQRLPLNWAMGPMGAGIVLAVAVIAGAAWARARAS
mmetsp:Transcript_41253/g.131115  ORF Transcript_41253/g.131115 Transcript_41253/m.131115 type:complete len:383 (+) Transcript_41253:88-1236(+)